jgi:hypothetical protein
VKKTLIILCLAAFSIVPAGQPFFVTAAPVQAQDNWKQEFEDVCGQTQIGDQLEAKELQGLVARCDALKVRMEKLSDPERKVMLSRLKRCRDFFAYLLQIKENK